MKLHGSQGEIDMTQDDLYRLQEELLNKELVAQLKIEAITPVLIGGYDARTHHACGYETLRPSSIKGVWRWWARMLVAAAVYRATGKFPDINTADSIVSRVLGSTKTSSLYRLVVQKEGGRDAMSEVEKQVIEITSKYGYYAGVPRVRLLKLGDPDKALGPGSRFEVLLYRRREDKGYDRFAVCSLMLALTLGGVGKATTRGFGKFAVRCNRLVCCDERLTYNKLVVGDVNTVENNLKKAIEAGVTEAEKLVKDDPNVNAEHDKPLFETPVDGYYHIAVVDKSFRFDSKALHAIGNATLKTKWEEDSQGKGPADYHTWILGLPRQTKERRKSPIIFTPLKRANNDYRIAILAFKTYDWREFVIKRMGVYKKEEVDKLIDTAFDEAIKRIIKIIERT
ncbi:MAG: type III-B CRISPR module RAMP protein Cmr1 [Pyrobaculum sp.]